MPAKMQLACHMRTVPTFVGTALFTDGVQARVRLATYLSVQFLGVSVPYALSEVWYHTQMESDMVARHLSN